MFLFPGSCNWDLIFQTERFPQPGETRVADFRSGPGGKGFNQAIAAHQAGASVGFVGAIGRDPFSQSLQDFAQSRRLKTHWAIKPDQSSGVAGITLDHSGQNHILVAAGANAHLSIDDIPPDWMSQATGLVLQCETNATTNLAALQHARAHNWLTILNPAPYRPEFLTPEVLALVDVITPNESEFIGLVHGCIGSGFNQLTEDNLSVLSPPVLQEICRHLGPEVVIITLGSKGAFLSLKDRFHHIPVLKNVSVVDTTGAGDAFIGGLSAGWQRYGNWLEAATFATVVAGLCVTRPGAASAMPTEHDILQRLASV